LCSLALSAHVIAQSIVPNFPATSHLVGQSAATAIIKTFLSTPFVAPQPHIPLFPPFQQIQTIGTIVTMATAAPQAIAIVMDTLANASEEHVEEIIKALKALPQCMKANTEATKMSAKTPSGVKKSRSKKERSKQDKAEGKGPKRPLNSWMAYRSESLAAIALQNFTDISQSSTTRCSAHALRKSSRKS
jgi:hypothetical protein